jgi:SOS-response transcriptional repressor LexA
VVGDIAAGEPITADEHVDDVLTLPPGSAKSITLIVGGHDSR